MSYETYAMTCVCTYWYNHSYDKNEGKNYERLLGCLTVRGLVITNTECHFQFQNLHSVTYTNYIESKDTSWQYFFISFLFKTKDPWRK